jgi:hypothetical protein
MKIRNSIRYVTPIKMVNDFIVSHGFRESRVNMALDNPGISMCHQYHFDHCKDENMVKSYSALLYINENIFSKRLGQSALTGNALQNMLHPSK